MTSSTLKMETTNKAQQITLKVLVGLMFTWMLMIGIFKLIGTEPALVETFKAMNYLQIMPLVGLLEILGGVGVLLPRFRTYAALGLLFLHFGGIASHLASGTYFPMTPLSVVAVLMDMCILKLDGKVKIG